ncbi:hypothetical protein QFC20_006534 [Naganishia adeliensis]|uniref:Uncharacterized protein n=1 Tax=Naganishia adeliensis TaxID=92952 RepID=A0ACC2V984_9TREE|nr:hypothetical protein QFC20_006534 [Naganishia adeliensis]
MIQHEPRDPAHNGATSSRTRSTAIRPRKRTVPSDDLEEEDAASSPASRKRRRLSGSRLSADEDDSDEGQVHAEGDGAEELVTEDDDETDQRVHNAGRNDVEEEEEDESHSDKDDVEKEEADIAPPKITRSGRVVKAAIEGADEMNL